ncbi:hypothetical protein [Pseudoruegeria sp. HB172150]|uniref:hypothetical protein n=1 Tax=Pseudoruegeria sp. HB172150 TaxID=2721164 RepID=UPI001551F9D9|nr:hypothetical protein [Pseudoruegeria sp. HB172150]
MRDWMITQYVVNYFEHGFVRRGLVGTLFHPFVMLAEDPALTAAIASWIVFFATSAAALVLADRALPHAEAETPDLRHGLRTALAVGCLGAVQVGYDQGRFDLLNMLLLAAALALVLRDRPLLAGAALTIGVLVHSAILFYGLPLAIVAQFLRSGKRWQSLLPLLLLPAIVVVAIFLFAESERAAGITVGNGTNAWDREVLFFDFALSWYVTALLVAFYLAVFALFLWFYRANRRRPDLLFLAVLAPLGLNLFGDDYGRWLVFTFYAAAMVIWLQTSRFGFRLPVLDRSGWWICLLLCLPIGPVGVNYIFPWWF